MNIIQKALRMLNESYKEDSKKQELIDEALVDCDGDVELASFNLSNFCGKSLTEDSKDIDFSKMGTDEKSNLAKDTEDVNILRKLAEDEDEDDYDDEPEREIDLEKLADDIIGHCMAEGDDAFEIKKMIEEKDDFMFNKLVRHEHTELFDDEDECWDYCKAHEDELFKTLEKVFYDNADWYFDPDTLAELGLDESCNKGNKKVNEGYKEDLKATINDLESALRAPKTSPKYSDLIANYTTVENAWKELKELKKRYNDLTGKKESLKVNEDLTQQYRDAAARFNKAVAEVTKYKIPYVRVQTNDGKTESQPDFNAIAEQNREAAKKAYNEYKSASSALSTVQDQWYKQQNESLNEAKDDDTTIDEKQFIEDILYYVNHTGEYPLYHKTKKEAEEILQKCKEALKTYIEYKFKNGWLVKWKDGKVYKREDIELVTDRNNEFYIIADDTDDLDEALDFEGSTKNINLNKMSDKERWDLAKTTTDANILRKLSRDSDASVLCYVARNNATPVEVLKQLANDEDEEVRAFVVENPNTPVDILKKLAKDESDFVRRAVAENPNTSELDDFANESIKDKKGCNKTTEELVDCDGDVEKENFTLKESVESSLPVHAMGEAAALDVIRSIKNGAAVVDENGNVVLDEHGDPVWKKHPTFFSLEYFKELDVAAKYRGGRGSTEEDPMVRIFKKSTFSRMYSGYSYESLGSVKKYRDETDKERSDRPTGLNFNAYSDDKDLFLKVAETKNGKVLRTYMTWNCKRTATYYISINDEDLRECSKDEVAQYLTAAAARDLQAPKEFAKTMQYTNPETGEIKQVTAPQWPVNYRISNIVNIKNFNN